MQLFKKTYFLIYPALFTILFLVFDWFEIIQNTGIKALISSVIAYVLSPKVKVIEKQNRSEEQIKWLFFKKVLNHKI